MNIEKIILEIKNEQSNIQQEINDLKKQQHLYGNIIAKIAFISENKDITIEEIKEIFLDYDLDYLDFIEE